MGKLNCVFLSLLLLVAFLPYSEKAWAFKQWVHEKITVPALESVGFDKDSADEVSDSNYYVDVFEFYVKGAHVDSNHLDLGSMRLKEKMKLIRDKALPTCQRRDALDAFGEALHTVQDLYAHSNAVDNNIVIPNILKMKEGNYWCNWEYAVAPGGLVTGHFNMVEFLYPCFLFFNPLFPEIYNQCIAHHNECTGKEAGDCCHRELNKDNEKALGGEANFLAACDLAEAETLNYWNIIKENIISKYSPAKATQFLKMLKRKQRTTIFVIDDTGSMGNDIAQVKVEVNNFLDALIAGDEAPTLGLLTFKDNVTTHGLFCDIDEFRGRINSLYASGGGDCPEASNRALVAAVGEIAVVKERSDIKLRGGSVILATDASAREPWLGPFIKRDALAAGVNISSIVTGDCVRTRSASRLGRLSDNNSANTAENETQFRTRSVRSGTDDPLTSPSSRIQLQALADQTGGVSFNVTRYEVGDVTPILLELGAPSTEVFFSQRVSLSPTETTIVEVPVDNTLSSRVTFMVTGVVRYSLPSVTIKRPDGTEVDATDPGITLMQLSSVISYGIENPQVGNWQIELSGEGNFLVRAFGQTDFRLNGLRLLHETPQPPRPEIDLVPVEGEIVSGAEIVTEIRFTTAPESVSMTLQRPDGSILFTPELTSKDGVRRFQATYNVPSEPFIIKLMGQTTEGNTFHREFPVILMPQTVGISVVPIYVPTPVDSTALFEAIVTNTGESPATYLVTGSSLLGWTVNTPSDPVAVEPGESQTVTMEVEVPAEAELGTVSDITVFVQDVNVSTTRNRTVVSIIVVDNDSDNDGVPNENDECENTNLESTVVIDGCDSNVENTLFANGCSISDLIGKCADDSKNHGQFSSCVSKLTNSLKHSDGNGALTGKQKGMIQRCAAKANIP